MTQRDLPVLFNTLGYIAKGLKEDFSPDRLDFYYDMLSDLSIEAVCVGLMASARTSPFFPKPADVRRLAGALMAPTDAAERAWERFRYALQHVTVYDTVDFQDATLHAVIRSMFGGWPQTLQIESAKIHFTRLEFLKAYVSLAKMGGHATEPLQGLMPGEVVTVAFGVLPSTPVLELTAESDLHEEARQGDTVPIQTALSQWLPSRI